MAGVDSQVGEAVSSWAPDLISFCHELMNDHDIISMFRPLWRFNSGFYVFMFIEFYFLTELEQITRSCLDYLTSPFFADVKKSINQCAALPPPKGNTDNILHCKWDKHVIMIIHCTASEIDM